MSADLVLRNGGFTTLDRSNPTATAVAITGGVFTAVGRDSDVMQSAGPDTVDGGDAQKVIVEAVVDDDDIRVWINFRRGAAPPLAGRRGDHAGRGSQFGLLAERQRRSHDGYAGRGLEQAAPRDKAASRVRFDRARHFILPIYIVTTIMHRHTLLSAKICVTCL